MTISNKLTILRIIMVPIFVVLMMMHLYIEAAVVFVIASATDWLDGYLARKRNEITNFGKFADPIADKILVVSALACLMEIGIIPAWAIIIVIAREFIVSGLRMSAASQNVVIAADGFGKIKTVTQMVSITMLLLGLWGIWATIAYILFYISVVLTFLSGVSYIIKYKDVLMK
ncbi:MAG: CDP-diacylglycerol--glycerol-3-phosphate 3-phosphatidyltransferase [Clostridia bacterium]|nr:CDP-diacylglycerol--glycerol-3-phosphate 3-phosphatidyltransferase [Clostridia bacterium]